MINDKLKELIDYYKGDYMRFHGWMNTIHPKTNKTPHMNIIQGSTMIVEQLIDEEIQEGEKK